MLLYRNAYQKTLASDKYPTETWLDKTKQEESHWPKNPNHLKKQKTVRKARNKRPQRRNTAMLQDNGSLASLKQQICISHFKEKILLRT